MLVDSFFSLFHIWTPGIFNFKGGIQVYSGFLLKALQNLYPRAQYDIFLKHDVTPSTTQSLAPNTQFHFAGRWPERLRTLVFANQLLTYGLRQRPNLIITTHLHFTLIAYWLKRLAGIPYWTVAHGVEAWDIERPSLQRALHHADQILAVSSYTQQRLLQEQALPANKVVILPNTVDAERFQISPKPGYLLQRYGIQPDQPILLTISRLIQSEQYKGYDRILDALPKICQAIPNVHYIIAGKGDDQERIRQIITKLNLQNHVTLAGFVPDKELCDHYNLCDLFAMPSKREGFGIVYLEALACGKPVLGGNKDGAIDALCHGELGILVDPDCVDEIAETIVHILRGEVQHPLLYHPQLLRRKVIETYGFEQFQQTLAAHLEQAKLFSHDAHRSLNSIPGA